MKKTSSVLITRPLLAARRTAQKILEKGFIPFVIPFSKIIPLFPVFPKFYPDALLATSENAFLHLESSCCSHLAHLPLYCVGQRTARAALLKGFSIFPIVAKNSCTLAACISKQEAMHFLYLAGKHRYHVLENWLRQSNIFIKTIEIYKTHFIPPSKEQLACLPKQIDSILVYSAMTARKLFMIEKSIGSETQILCLSPRIVASLPVKLFQKARVAEEPTESSLLALLLSL